MKEDDVIIIDVRFLLSFLAVYLSKEESFRFFVFCVTIIVS